MDNKIEQGLHAPVNFASTEIHKFMYEIHEIRKSEEWFIGNSFTVNIDGTISLVTAAHIAFHGMNSEKPRKLVARSFDGRNIINNPTFKKLPERDAAIANLHGLHEGLILDETITSETHLCMYAFTGRCQDFFNLKPITIGDTSIRYVGIYEYDSPMSGCSGAPIINELTGMVIGVHKSGYYNQEGKRLASWGALLKRKDFNH